MLANRDGLIVDAQTTTFDTGSYRDWKTAISHHPYQPEIIINTAAITDVDGCEVNRDQAWKSNVNLVEILASLCRARDAWLIQLSSDHVFDGIQGPYTELSEPHPANFYGRTKLAAENICTRIGIEHTIIRTMWLYGEENSNKKNIIDWVNRQLTSGGEIHGATDEIGNPTLIDDLAYGIIKLIIKRIKGLINIAGAERISRHEFICKIANSLHLPTEKILPISSEQLHRKAKRPLNSGLICLKAASVLDYPQRSVEEGLIQCQIRALRNGGMRYN